MDREQIIAVIKNLAGPLGPFQDVEEVQDWLRLREDAYKNIETDPIDLLLDILKNRPTSQSLGQICWADFEIEIVEMLSHFARRNVTSFLKKAEPLFRLDLARPALIDIVGNLHNQDGISASSQNSGAKMRPMETMCCFWATAIG